MTEMKKVDSAAKKLPLKTKEISTGTDNGGEVSIQKIGRVWKVLKLDICTSNRVYSRLFYLKGGRLKYYVETIESFRSAEGVNSGKELLRVVYIIEKSGVQGRVVNSSPNGLSSWNGVKSYSWLKEHTQKVMQIVTSNNSDSELTSF